MAYNGDENQVATYGRLYTWFATTDGRKVCPTGLHIPTDAEWEALINYYMTDANEPGNQLKEAGLNHWITPNAGASNSRGFTALPGAGDIMEVLVSTLVFMHTGGPQQELHLLKQSTGV